MISSQIIQTSIEELKNITKVDLGVYELSGVPVATTMEKTDISTGMISTFADSPADSQVIGNCHLMKIYDDNELLYVVIACGAADDAYMVGRIAVCQLQNLAVAYRERFDRNSFFCGGCTGFKASKYCFDTGDQFFSVKWFFHVVICSEL